MKFDSIFDVLGHIMVGPSSSHTAGACRIGYIAQKLFGETPESVKIYLHGSFSETYRGHKTDIAIIGGLLGFQPDNEQIPISFELAKEQGMNFIFEKKDLGEDIHPNSVQLILSKEISNGTNKTLELIGSSVGGGNIIIQEIDHMEAGFSANEPTIIEIHQDIPGVLAKIMGKISEHHINVNRMRLSRNIRKKIALSWIEVSKNLETEVIEAIKAIPDVIQVRWLNV